VEVLLVVVPEVAENWTRFNKVEEAVLKMPLYRERSPEAERVPEAFTLPVVFKVAALMVCAERVPVMELEAAFRIAAPLT
jgi:hypothetical protein